MRRPPTVESSRRDPRVLPIIVWSLRIPRSRRVEKGITIRTANSLPPFSTEAVPPRRRRPPGSIPLPVVVIGAIGARIIENSEGSV